MKKLLVTIMSAMLIFSISQAYVVTIHGPNCTFKMNSPSDSEIILSDLKNGIRWWKVTDNSNNIIGVINNEFMMPEDNVKVTPMYEGNQIVSIQTEGGAIKYNGNKVNTVETTEGRNYEFTIEADTGYKIKSLTIDGTSTTVSSTYTFTNVKENHTIKATFEKIIPILPNTWYGTPTVGETTIEKSSITSISLVDTYTPGEGVKTYWNASYKQADGILTAYLEDGSENGKYKITIAGNGAGKISAGISIVGTFGNFSSVTEITGLELLDTSNVQYMNYMFNECGRLTSLDVSNFDTSNVINMQAIFRRCSSLSSLDVSNFNTNSVTNMKEMFFGCSSLSSLDVSNFNISNVTSMDDMFNGCSGLTSLDVSNFNTSNVTSMGAMFFGCSSLSSLDVSNFNTSNVTSMGGMFNGCSGLTSLDVSDFNTSNVTSMGGMFNGCSGLTSLDVSNFNTSNVTSMGYMFYRCGRLTSLDVSNFDTSNVINMQAIFRGCSSLSSLDVSNFNTNSVTNMKEMFYNCSSLSSLDLSNFNTSNVESMNQMLDTMFNLQQITLGKDFSFYGANKAEPLYTLPNPVGGETWYDENGTEYTKEDGIWRDEDGNELGESSKTVTYYATNPVQ